MKLRAICIFLASLALAGDAAAAPTGLPDHALDLELKEARIENIFRLLAEVSQKNIVLDPCVHGAVDLKLKNAPLPVVFDVLAAKLRLTYRTNKDAIQVGCLDMASAGDADPRLDKRMDIDVREASLGAVVGLVAQGATVRGPTPADMPPGSNDVKVTIALRGARIRTILAAIADTTGWSAELRGDALVITR